MLLDSDTMQTIDFDPTRDFAEIHRKDDTGTVTNYKLHDTVMLEKGQTYVFTQLATGPEYTPIENTIEFTVNDDGSISVDPRYSSDLGYDSETGCLLVLNKKYVPAYVSVYVPVFKVDGTDYLGVPDAVLTVYDSVNNVVETWLTTGGPHILGSTGRYTPGTYRIVETTVPPGYRLADPIVFEVDADGNVLIGQNQVSQITMVDMPLTRTITIIKEWEDNQNELNLRPDDLELHALAGEDEISIIDSSEWEQNENTWEKTITVQVPDEFTDDLAVYEEVPDYYQGNGLEDPVLVENDTAVLTNRLTLYYLEITKVWNDADDMLGNRPEELTIHCL